MELLVERILEALRADPVVGRGTCSMIDECRSDDELRLEIRENLADGSVKTVADAIDLERQIQRVFIEREG